MLADIVERLSNWKHASFRRDGSTLETMMEAADEITSLREQLEKAKKDGWISVEDRLPRKKQEVIIFAPSINNKDEAIYAVCLYWGEFLQYDLEVDKYCQPTVCVTHWQPLPKIPAESF